MSTDLSARARHPWRRLAAENLLVVLVFAGVGAAAGRLWFGLWEAPQGGVQDGVWLYEDFDAIGQVFDATAQYVVIGLLAGLVLGVVAALLCRRSELVTLVAVAAGSVLAAYLAHRVGLSLSPPDPQVLAATLPEGTELPGSLTLPGRSPYVAWPLGALVGLTFTYFLTSGVSAGVTEAQRLDEATRG